MRPTPAGDEARAAAAHLRSEPHRTRRITSPVVSFTPAVVEMHWSPRSATRQCGSYSLLSAYRDAYLAGRRAVTNQHCQRLGAVVGTESIGA
jgi:hypothetical protein